MSNVFLVSHIPLSLTFDPYDDIFWIAEL